jgi:hypothetical protein
MQSIAEGQSSRQMSRIGVLTDDPALIQVLMPMKV